MTLPLALLLYVLGIVGPVADTEVRITTLPVLGVACHQDFGEQELCGDAPDGTIMLSWRTLGSWELARNVVEHERWHLAHRDGTETEAYAAGCEASWVRELCVEETQ